ncbi:MAG: 4Fe-4S binding protein [Deltaproteobacteria bacterium]|nr:4Fe-4S binding protein [Deltaproteobacteria bacterium]
MTSEVKDTVFHLDESLCTGCGKCIKDCLTKILEIVDGRCVMTEPFKCLECGRCMQECPENAITIKSVSPEGEQATKDIDGKKVQFVPILRELTKMMLEELGSVQLYEFEGIDIRELDNFEIEGERCYTRLYQTDKIEKTSISSSIFYGLSCSKAMCLTPSEEYDFPSFVMDWVEAEDAIFFLCDFLPADDPGRNRDYLTKYLYTPLEDLYSKYSDIPGIEPINLYWVRALASPYIIVGNVEKTPRKNVDKIFDCALGYFRAWIEIWREAKPQDPDSEYMKLVNERKKMAREIYIENDPAAGILNKFLDEEKAHTIMKLVMP